MSQSKLKRIRIQRYWLNNYKHKIFLFSLDLQPVELNNENKDSAEMQESVDVKKSEQSIVQTENENEHTTKEMMLIDIDEANQSSDALSINSTNASNNKNPISQSKLRRIRMQKYWLNSCKYKTFFSLDMQPVELNNEENIGIGENEIPDIDTENQLNRTFDKDDSDDTNTNEHGLSINGIEIRNDYVQTNPDQATLEPKRLSRGFRFPTPFKNKQNFRFNKDDVENFSFGSHVDNRLSTSLPLTSENDHDMIVDNNNMKNCSLIEEKGKRNVYFHSPANQTTTVDDLDLLFAQRQNKLIEKNCGKKPDTKTTSSKLF